MAHGSHSVELAFAEGEQELNRRRARLNVAR